MKLKIFSYPFIAALIVGSLNTPQQKAGAAIQNEQKKALVENSFRMTFPLSSPRRYATKFDKENRTLQIRILPAQMSEFQDLSYYDPQFINKVLVREDLSEVFITLQLKNTPMAWLIGTQENPWRIIIDIWKTEVSQGEEGKNWSWYSDNVTGEMPIAGASDTANDSQSKNLKMTKEISKETKDQNLKNNTKKEILTSQNEIKNPNITYSKTTAQIPDIFRALFPVVPLDEDKRKVLTKKFETNFEKKEEFPLAQQLAELLYKGGYYTDALHIYRKILMLNEPEFKKHEDFFWQAGESSFLTGNQDIAYEYFNALVTLFPENRLFPYAKLRLVDIDELTNSKSHGLEKVSDKNSEIYTKMAFDTSLPIKVQELAALRSAFDHVDENPSYVSNFLDLIQKCTSDSSLDFMISKHCSYIVAKISINDSPIPEADKNVQTYKKLVPSDPRISQMEKIVSNRVKDFLDKVTINKDYKSWIELESKLRSSLLDFSIDHHEELFTRADAFENVRNEKKALQLYSAFIQGKEEQKWKNEAYSRSAVILYNKNLPNAADENLLRIEEDNSRIQNGFTDKTLNNLKKLTLTPFKNKIAFRLIIQEIKQGRYVERELTALSQWGKQVLGTPYAEIIFDKIRSYPAKSPDEIEIVESSVLRYAEDLRNNGQFAKAGDYFFYAASLSNANHVAEAAYKAGVVYARAGLFEKAKQAWILAANDTNDKRFSALANERLDRTSK